MVAGPDWKGETPPGIKKVFPSTTQFSLAIFRTQLFNPADMPNVDKVQAGYKAQPLSAFLKQPAPPAAPTINFPKINKELAKTNFFDYLDFALAIRARRTRRKSDPRETGSHSASRQARLRLQGALAGTEGRRRSRA